MSAVDQISPLALSYGGPGSDLASIVVIPVALLKGKAEEILLGGDGSLRQSGLFQLQQSTQGLAGLAACSLEAGLEETSYQLYSELFHVLRETDQHAHRLWHYVPDINGSAGALENYRVFNVGRRRAFDEFFGTQAESFMPAASAVGTPGQELVVAFVGGKTPPRFVENPKQTPAYRYPADYGPKTPSFARAAVADRQVYISGTASISGHETRHPGDLLGQWNVTFENLETIAAQVGAETWSQLSTRPDYRLKVYLRNAADLAPLWPLLQRFLGATEQNAIVLQADICRAELDLEIEASFGI